MPGLTRRRLDATLLAAGAGACAAVLQYAGALKSVPGIAGLPFDLSVWAALLLAPGLLFLVVQRQWFIAPALAWPLLGTAGLWLWLVVAGAWSTSHTVLAEKLPQAVLLGPLMLLAGMVVGSDGPTRARLTGAVLPIGVVVAVGVVWGVLTGQVILGGAVGQDPERVRVQYQLAGLAIACAAGLAAVRTVEAVHWSGRLAWLALVATLAAAILVPGGRAALIGLGLAVAGAPFLRLWLARRPVAALGWVALVGLVGATGLASLLADPGRASGLATLERLYGAANTETPARLILWGQALRWAGTAAPFGLGTGAFSIAAGFGEDRGFYPHNHALEALVEGGLPGLFFWLLAFGGGVALAIGQAWRTAPARVARIAALTLPVALSVMVSTDLGNRMAWLALGLLLSLAVEARRV